MEYIIVFALICYIGFIHYQMNKKNQLIEGMIEKLGKLERNWDSDHILALLEKYQTQQKKYIISRNKLFDEPVLKFIFSS